jgi:NAD(P)-dependent dehydrogenase (short-subunit alcohol dehydrogenase family)
MIQRGFGRVIHLSSSIQHRPSEMAYACSKAALDKFVHDLAPTLSGTGVILSMLDPGWTSTDMGGPEAPHIPDSVLPGALLGAMMKGDFNSEWFHAQDYAGMSLESALGKASIGRDWYTP